MLVIIGYLIVVLCVFGAFAISGGHLVLIFEPWHEYVIIAGAAFGGLVVKSNARTLKLIFQRITNAFKGKSPSREQYLEALKLVYDLAALARREGILALENHIQNPQNSTIFQRYPRIVSQQRVVRFITDNLKIVVVGGTSPSDLESLMDADIETIEEENAAPQMLLSNTADALPALGIVAAVLGIIKTMASIAEGPEVVG
ncbi:MAG: motility-associated protein, partial [bacterium]